MYSDYQDDLAHELCKAIKKLGENENALSNFESYLSYHFKEWIEKFACTPEGLAAEFMTFANMYDKESAL
jgi:hypothetical protein